MEIFSISMIIGITVLIFFDAKKALEEMEKRIGRECKQPKAK